MISLWHVFVVFWIINILMLPIIMAQNCFYCCFIWFERKKEKILTSFDLLSTHDVSVIGTREKKSDNDNCCWSICNIGSSFGRRSWRSWCMEWRRSWNNWIWFAISWSWQIWSNHAVDPVDIIVDRRVVSHRLEILCAHFCCVCAISWRNNGRQHTNKLVITHQWRSAIIALAQLFARHLAHEAVAEEVIWANIDRCDLSKLCRVVSTAEPILGYWSWLRLLERIRAVWLKIQKSKRNRQPESR